MHNAARATSNTLVATLLTVALSACVGGGNTPGIGGSGGSGGTGGPDGGCVEVDCGNGCRVCGSASCEFFCGIGGGGGVGGFSGVGGFGGGDEDGGIVTQPWTSPFNDNGEDGSWRSTRDPFCSGASFFDALSLWSDARGVYVLASGAFDRNVLNAQKRGPRIRAPRAIDAGPPNEPDAPGAAPPPIDAGFGGEGGGAGFMGFGGFGGTAGFGGTGGSTCDPMIGSCDSRVIYFNDGRGWRVDFEREGLFPNEQLSGLPGADRVVWRPRFESGLCSLSMIDGDDERCENTGSEVSAFFAVDAQLAFASVADNLMVYDGSTWSVHPTRMPFAPLALWANATDVVIVGDFGRIARLRDGEWTSANHSIQRLTAVWGGAGDELWVGTDSGDVMRRDESGAWLDNIRVGGVTCTRISPIRGLWGADGVVYAYTERALVRIDASGARYLGNWSCASGDAFSGPGKQIQGLWGNAPDEVFIVVSDSSRFLDFREQCGNGFVLYYDGALIHRL